jgi:hypothetical protein
MIRNRWGGATAIPVLLASLCCGCASDEPEVAPELGPPPNRVFVDELGAFIEDPPAWLASGEPLFFPDPDGAREGELICWVPDADSQDSDGPMGGECAADGVVTGPGAETGELFPSKYCRHARCAKPVDSSSGEGVTAY